jgi:hypothetical protein
MGLHPSFFIHPLKKLKFGKRIKPPPFPTKGGDFDLCTLIFFFLEKRGAKDIVKCSYWFGYNFKIIEHRFLVGQCPRTTLDTMPHLIR